MISWRPSIWPTTARATRPASAANRPSTSACGRIACSTFACWSARSVTSTPGSGGSAAPARSAAVEARKLGSRAQAQQGPLRRRQGTPCPEGFPGTPASAQARGKGHPRTQMLFEQSLPLYRRAGERLGVTLTATAAAADHPQRHRGGGDLGRAQKVLLSSQAMAGGQDRQVLPGYRGARGDNHHHLVCRSCGAVKDVDCLAVIRPAWIRWTTPATWSTRPMPRSGDCAAVPSGGRLPRGHAHRLDRDPLDVALEADDVSRPAGAGRPGRHDQTRSNRSRFITLSHAATKSFTNFSFASSLA